MRCYAGAARRKPYVVPSSTKWLHFTHLTQMTSSECKQFLKIIFHAFQHLHLTLDGIADLLGTCYIKTDHCLMLASKDNTTLALPRGSKGCAKVLEGLPMLWRMISSAANFADRHSKKTAHNQGGEIWYMRCVCWFFELKLSAVKQLTNSSNIPSHVNV